MKARPKSEKWICAGRQALGWFAPRVRARLDAHEPVAALVVRQAAAGAGEVRVERGRVLVAVVEVAAGGVRLPDLDQRRADRPAVAVGDPAGDDDPLAERLALVLAGEVVVELADGVVAVDRPGQLRQRPREQQQRLPRRARDGRAVVGIEVRRVWARRPCRGRARARCAGRLLIRLAVSPFAGFSARSASSSASRRRRARTQALRHAERPAGRLARLLDADVGMELGQGQLARLVGLEHAEVGDDARHARAADALLRRSSGSRAPRRTPSATASASRTSRGTTRRSRARRPPRAGARAGRRSCRSRCC